MATETPDPKNPASGEADGPSADWLASSPAYRRRARKRARRINKLLAACAAGDRPSLRMEAIALMAADISDHLRDLEGRVSDG